MEENGRLRKHLVVAMSHRSDPAPLAQLSVWCGLVRFTEVDNGGYVLIVEYVVDGEVSPGNIALLVEQ